MEIPDLKDHFYERENKFPAIVLTSRLSDSANQDGHQLANALPLMELFYSDVFISYYVVQYGFFSNFDQTTKHVS